VHLIEVDQRLSEPAETEDATGLIVPSL